MDQSKINRRRFLGTVGAAATGIALAAHATAQAQDTNATSPISGSGSNPDALARTVLATGERVTGRPTYRWRRIREAAARCWLRI